MLKTFFVIKKTSNQETDLKILAQTVPI